MRCCLAVGLLLLELIGNIFYCLLHNPACFIVGTDPYVSVCGGVQRIRQAPDKMKQKSR